MAVDIVPHAATKFAADTVRNERQSQMIDARTDTPPPDMPVTDTRTTARLAAGTCRYHGNTSERRNVTNLPCHRQSLCPTLQQRRCAAVVSASKRSPTATALWYWYYAGAICVTASERRWWSIRKQRFICGSDLFTASMYRLPPSILLQIDVSLFILRKLHVPSAVQAARTDSPAAAVLSTFATGTHVFLRVLCKTEFYSAVFRAVLEQVEQSSRQSVGVRRPATLCSRKSTLLSTGCGKIK